MYNIQSKRNSQFSVTGGGDGKGKHGFSFSRQGKETTAATDSFFERSQRLDTTTSVSFSASALGSSRSKPPPPPPSFFAREFDATVNKAADRQQKRDLTCRLPSELVNNNNLSIRSNGSADLFLDEDDDHEERKLLEEIEACKQRIRNLQRKKKEVVQEHEKKRAELKESAARDTESCGLIKSKLQKMEEQIKIVNTQKREALAVSVFYEPLYKRLGINQIKTTPVCGEGKLLLPIEGSTPQTETCDFWKCPSNAVDAKPSEPEPKTGTNQSHNSTPSSISKLA